MVTSGEMPVPNPIGSALLDASQFQGVPERPAGNVESAPFGELLPSLGGHQSPAGKIGPEPVADGREQLRRPVIGGRVVGERDVSDVAPASGAINSHAAIVPALNRHVIRDSAGAAHSESAASATSAGFQSSRAHAKRPNRITRHSTRNSAASAGASVTPYARAQDALPEDAALLAPQQRILDADGHAWPITGATCANCHMPLTQAQPAQLFHPLCELEARR